MILHSREYKNNTNIDAEQWTGMELEGQSPVAPKTSSGSTFYAVNLDLPGHAEPLCKSFCEKGIQFPSPPPDVSRVAYITNVNLAAACTACKLTQARFTGMDTGRGPLVL